MDLNYTEEHKNQMLQSGRKGGFKKDLPVVIKYIMEHEELYQNQNILDFGCGPNAYGLKRLRKLEFTNVYGYDLPENAPTWSDFYDEKALHKKWDVIALSNVINVQPNYETTVLLVCKLAAENLNPNGQILFNYPRSPRYVRFRLNDFKDTLHDMLDVNFDKSGSVHIITLN